MERKMVILGINAYHGDSSACIVSDGELLCAIEEERIARVKHWAGLPIASIKWCLDYSELNITDLDYIALSRDPFARWPKKFLRLLHSNPGPAFLNSRLANYGRIRNIRKELSANPVFSPGEIKAKIIYVDHHKAHLASSFFVSPFQSSAVISIDGFGDFVSTMLGFGRGNQLGRLSAVEFPHSLGILYTALTQFLGFWNYGDEYKVMGLSAFGKPAYLDKLRKLIRLKKNGLFAIDTTYFLHDKEGVEMSWLNEAPLLNRIFSPKLTGLLGEPRGEGEEISRRFGDIASSLQALYEETFFHLLRHLYKKNPSENLCLSGGCAQNSLANGKIYGQTDFKNIYIPPAAHDGGAAIGAAYYLWHALLGKPRKFVMNSPYYGPEFSSAQIKLFLDDSGIKYEELSEEELIARASDDIISGRIIGWFQGRTEWGARALGNRSILADPRSEQVKDILNSRIKKREWFRPFAPSIMEEFTAEWFEKNAAAPFMEKVYKVREEKRNLIPAVMQVDGTARLQTVNLKLNPLYYKLLSKFHAITGVPLLLNTSFNENEPMVNTPKDALVCFQRAGMDALFIGNFYISR